MKLVSVDLFSGCGGLTLGMKRAGFDTRVAVEIDESAVSTFKLNHRTSKVINRDIRLVTGKDINEYIGDSQVHFLAGCPPCQGFSSIRRLNKRRNIRDERNGLILEYLRLVQELRPLTIMMENVPGLKDYYLFKKVLTALRNAGYELDYQIVNVKDYGVAQSRKRLVLVGSLLGPIKVATNLGVRKRKVRTVIGKMPEPAESNDWVHQKIARHTEDIQRRIEATPKDGGGRHDLPEEYTLTCHKTTGIGFNDIYGRLRWNDVSSTITGGCLNPSKGRFLHPEQNRCISAREAAMLQSFPRTYRFDSNSTKTNLALMIGNALPPKFSYYQSLNIYGHLKGHLESQ